MKLSCEIDGGCGHRARIGLIVLQTDETLEYEINRLLAIEGVVIHVTRIPSGVEVSPATLAAMEGAIPSATGLFPGGASFDAVAYCCTSGATVIGEDKVRDLIQSVMGNIAVTNPMTAVKALCAHLGLRRLGFVTPYVAEISAEMRRNLEAAGIEITAFNSFEIAQERTVARISEASVLRAIIETASQAPCDAIFASCTNLRSLGIIEKAEDAVGKPVISSNLALAWHLARFADLSGELAINCRVCDRQYA